MDAMVADLFSKWYTYLYHHFHHKMDYYAPPPDQLFPRMRQIIDVISAYSPPIVRVYYTILNANILPAIINTVCHSDENSCSVNSETIKTVAVLIALLVLYAIFAIVLFVVRGITRCILALVRLGSLTALLLLFACIVVSIVSATALQGNNPS
ncbi:hypothetical protein BDF20DRAFT_901464 [Mycotypha africana]|uniref:uncharacterized protein n=1 Tax=Mycotypha africana TaxID=64632 RepID=UPI002301CCCE|nr:uncharacterized protein BDF20DRAFT_901464 [Mycotypha africana]KAI8967247.1 hypothetical protein BDF20DRAFT_901464 [Mycotypha africana]